MFIKRNIAIVRDNRFAGVIGVSGDGNCLDGRCIIAKSRLKIRCHVAFHRQPLVNARRAAFGDDHAHTFGITAGDNSAGGALPSHT